jgi:hypothetical protein
LGAHPSPPVDLPQHVQLWEAHPIEDFPADKEDDHYDPLEENVVVKQEADNEIAAGDDHLPSELQAVLAAWYDEEALL